MSLSEHSVPQRLEEAIGYREICLKVKNNNQSNKQTNKQKNRTI